MRKRFLLRNLRYGKVCFYAWRVTAVVLPCTWPSFLRSATQTWRLNSNFCDIIYDETVNLTRWAIINIQDSYLVSSLTMLRSLLSWWKDALLKYTDQFVFRAILGKAFWKSPQMRKDPKSRIKIKDTQGSRYLVFSGTIPRSILSWWMRCWNIEINLCSEQFSVTKSPKTLSKTINIKTGALRILWTLS